MNVEDIRIMFLRDTTAYNNNYTGREGELTIDRDKKQLRIHDGVTKGGMALINADDIKNYLALAGGTMTGPINMPGSTKIEGVNGGFRVTVGSNGTVLVGNDASRTKYTSSKNHHHFNGEVTADGNITGFSDARLKRNTKVIQNALEKLFQVSGYTFERIDMDGLTQTGVIAQEILKVLPEAVVKDLETGLLRVANGNLVGFLIEALKEETMERRKLEERVVAIEKVLEKHT